MQTPEGPKVVLSFPAGVPVDWGNLDVCILTHGVRITSVVPERFTTGDVVTIRGLGFGNNPDNICAVVMNGAVIGRGSIVAPGAVVTEGTVIPPHSIVAGVPARVIKTRDCTRENRMNAFAYHRNAEAYRRGEHRAWEGEDYQRFLAERLAEIERG